MIVVVSHLQDPHALVVLQALRERGADVHLLDTARFPRDLRLAIDPAGGEAFTARVTEDGVTRDLADARVVWWRRPQPFTLDAALGTGDDRAFAWGECHHAMTGLWSALDATWINDPLNDEAASRKVWQLKAAAEVGLRTPRTCVTNDPGRAREFVERAGDRVIYKAFAGTEHAWRETRLLRPDERRLLDAVRYAPVIFQEHIEAVADIRVTIVADELFAAAIDARETAYPEDFRMDFEHADVSAHHLPDDVRDGLLELMRRAGIVYGAADLRLTPDGRYVFLEVNPAGQWLFVEQLTGQPITDALCRFMTAHDGPRDAGTVGASRRSPA